MGWAKKSQTAVGSQIDLSGANSRRRPRPTSVPERSGRADSRADSKRAKSSRFAPSRNIAAIDFNARPTSVSSAVDAPELARRRQNRKSTIKSGRTIGEKREKLETASERQATHRKSRRRRRTRIFFVSFTFILAAICIVVLYTFFFRRGETPLVPAQTAKIYEPTIEIVDDAAAVGGAITDRMKNYIGQAEADFRDLGYTPVKAVIPSGSVREVDFYLKDQPGYIKFILDRSTAESVEDTDRLIRYLRDQRITTYEYLDVRLPLKAYWK